MEGLTLTAVFNAQNMTLPPFSFGIGDRFGQQGAYQLKAIQELAYRGIEVIPVWNKSHREHTTVGSMPAAVLAEARKTVHAMGWTRQWHVDADHITMATVDAYTDHADFFTIDVAAQINSQLNDNDLREYLDTCGHLEGEIFIEGRDTPYYLTRDELVACGHRYWHAAKEAGKIYQHIAERKDAFIAEVSMDEVEAPQKPVELYLILKMLSDRGVMLQTIAPKFTGRFNKGVDYEGDTEQFAREFEEDLLVLKTAMKEFNLPPSLKLSVHTGSDKFSLYPIMKNLIRRHHAGIHVKTAGTTWLEEATGLAMAGGDGLTLVREIYREAFDRYDELTIPYANVLNIRRHDLPEPTEFEKLTPEETAETIRHEPENPMFNPGIRQLMHTAYKIAAEKNDRFILLIRENRELVGRQVYENLFERHLSPLFL